MRGRIQGWAKRNPLRAAIVLDIAMVATTVLFTVIALGPDSLLDECSGRSHRHCIGSHGQAGGMAIASGVIAAIFLAMTWSGIRSGRLRRRPPSSDAESSSGERPGEEEDSAGDGGPGEVGEADS